MKDKILTFIIGLLVGAIIATIGFYIYSQNNVSNQGRNGGPGTFQNGERPEMPNGNMDGNIPPAKPGEENQAMNENMPNSSTMENAENSNGTENDA